MSDVKWIKIVSDIFDDEKILLIESLPKADNMIVIWFKLLCLAGKNNNSGVFVIGDKVPYTDEMLATIFRRDIKTVRLAMKTFEEYGMVKVIDGVYTLPNWGKYQSLEKIENRAAYMKNYMSEYREKQKKKAECKQVCKPNSKVNSDVNKEVNSKLNENVNSVNSKPNSKHDVNCAEEDIYKEYKKEQDKEEERDILTISNEIVCRKQSQEIIEKWNRLQDVGIKPVSRIAGNSERNDRLKARIRQYGMEKVLYAIEKIRESDFLQGKNRDGWVITFDWFVRPGNFPKVLEGNYDNRSGTKSYQSQTKQMLDSSYEMMGDWARKRMEGDGENDT